MREVEDDEESEEGYTCPWCMKEHQTVAHIHNCSGFRASGMPANKTGHPYGCGCQECRAEYQEL